MTYQYTNHKKTASPIAWMLLTIGVQSTLKDVFSYVPFKLNSLLLALAWNVLGGSRKEDYTQLLYSCTV